MRSCISIHFGISHFFEDSAHTPDHCSKIQCQNIPINGTILFDMITFDLIHRNILHSFGVQNGLVYAPEG